MKIFNSAGAYDIKHESPSVFLAGPSLRIDEESVNDGIRGWRNDAVKLFKNFGFNGALYIPEPMGGDYQKQIEWEVYHLETADCILFWVPRDLETLPGFTTNVEFGEWMRSGKIVLGTPPNAAKMRYLIYRAKKYGAPVLNNLPDTISAAIKKLNEKSFKHR